MKPLAIDLYCGLGGWAEGLLAEGYRVIGFDNERHVYGDHRYPAQLVVQDVRTLHGSQFRDADLIVASPPCTEYSYMAMPWSRAKQIARALRGKDDFPEGYTGSRTVAELNELFDACFRIQREACEAAGRHIPMVVENVRGAQPWVGRARWNYGSYYLWGDVPALMPITPKRRMKYTGSCAARKWRDRDVSRLNDGYKSSGMDWSDRSTRLVGGQRAVKVGGDWFSDPDAPCRTSSSKSPARKVASALIAKIPPDLARHIARTFRPRGQHERTPLQTRG